MLFTGALLNGISDSIGLGQSPRAGVPDKLSGDAMAAGPQDTLSSVDVQQSFPALPDDMYHLGSKRQSFPDSSPGDSNSSGQGQIPKIFILSKYLGKFISLDSWGNTDGA